MNFLAHLYLSGDHPPVMVGNFIGDFVKGRELAAVLGPGVAAGVELHRAIDEFTDRHPVVKESKNRLRPKYRHYAGVITDIFYDHYLAVRWDEYHSEALESYASRAYQLVIDHDAVLPERVKQMLPFMMRGNWLLNYARLEGIERALSGMSRRTSFESRMDESIDELRTYYDDFDREFQLFFPELKDFSEQWLARNLPERI